MHTSILTQAIEIYIVILRTPENVVSVK